jgi:hypothetical protein
VLVRKARRTAAAEDAEEANKEGNNEMDMDKEMDVDKIDQATEAAPDQSTTSVRSEKQTFQQASQVKPAGWLE